MGIEDDILLAVAELQGNGGEYVPFTAISERTGMPLEDIHGELDILEEAGRVHVAKWRSGYAAYLTPKHKALLKRSTAMPAPREDSPGDPKKVFVVHGRNEEARKEMFAFLSALGLEPLAWRGLKKATGEATPYTRDVVQKGFSLARAAIVLFTPDDEGRLREMWQAGDDPADETELTPQPRQNVLFEAGMAFGIYPDRTLVVEFGKLRRISDLAGLNVVRVKNDLTAKRDIISALEAAGCDVNRDGDWDQAGDFSLVLREINKANSQEAAAEGATRTATDGPPVNDAVPKDDRDIVEKAVKELIWDFRETDFGEEYVVDRISELMGSVRREDIHVWFEHLGSMLRAYKWSKTLPCRELLRPLGCIINSRATNSTISLDALASLHSLYSRLDKADRESLEETIVMMINTKVSVGWGRRG